MNNIERIMEERGVVSLKALAAVFGLNAVRLYSVAKTPKEGVIYDAKEYNWDAVERFCTKRLDKDANEPLGTLEKIIDLALAEDERLRNTDRRRAAGGTPASALPTIEVDGREMPVRRFKNFEIDFLVEYDTDGNFVEEREGVHPAGQHVILLKRDPNVYSIIYQTTGYTVLLPIDAAGQPCSETPKLLSNSLLNIRGYAPSALTAEAVATKYAQQ